MFYLPLTADVKYVMMTTSKKAKYTAFMIESLVTAHLMSLRKLYWLLSDWLLLYAAFYT